MSAVEDKKKPEEVVEEDEYRESEDEDYNPEGAKAEKGGEEEDSDDDDDDDENFEEGENKKELEKKYQDIQGGGLIKTRRQQEEEEKKGKNYEAVDVPAVKPNVDIDAIWAQMKNGTDEPSEKESAKTTAEEEKSAIKATTEGQTTNDENTDSSEYITITRTYKFAGEVHKEEKRVHRNSGEAQDYLKQQKESSAPAEKNKRPPPRRKKRSSLQAELDSAKAKKMNTLEKSRLDWLGFVDQEGIKDQLTHHNKGGYLHKQDFLSRVEHNLEESRRQAAKKN